MRTAQRAQLALLLEVAGTPKPGNVDRCREYPELRFEHFLAGAVGAYDGLADAAHGEPIGMAFETAVGGMSDQDGGNTQFGALLLLVPLVRAASLNRLSTAGVTDVVTGTTVQDAVSFFRAFDYVAVSVNPPPEELADLDVRQGSAAAPAVVDRGVSLYDVMELSADGDGVAREWVTGFSRSFEAAERILAGDGSVPTRASRAFLQVLAAEPDTFIETQHDAETARDASARAQAVLDGEGSADDLAEVFVANGINPGTSADLVAAGLYIALEHGLRV